MALTDKEKAARFDKQMKNQMRNRARRAVIYDKAVVQGITATPAEIDAWLAKHSKGK